MAADSKSSELIPLDMSVGYAVADQQMIYLIVKIQGTDEKVLITFYNGYVWDETETYKFEYKEEKKPETFEEYMKRNKGKGLKIERRYSK